VTISKGNDGETMPVRALARVDGSLSAFGAADDLGTDGSGSMR
jgi:hypothetical protein